MDLKDKIPRDRKLWIQHAYVSRLHRKVLDLYKTAMVGYGMVVWRPNTGRRIDSSEVFFVSLWPRHCNFSNCEIENLNLYHEIQQKSTLPFLAVVVWFRILLLLHSQLRQLIWCIFCIKIFLKKLNFNWLTVMWLVSSTIQLYVKSSTPWSIGDYQCIYWYPKMKFNSRWKGKTIKESYSKCNAQFFGFKLRYQWAHTSVLTTATL
jgi:hypothetical protein